MATVVDIPYAPRPQQRLIHEALDRYRWVVAVCHRRMGKTVGAVNHLQRAALTCAKERPRFAYLAPTYRQGKATAWDYIIHYAAPVPATTVNHTELRVDYGLNGGQVRIYGADNPDSLRGLYLDGVVLDEYGLHPPTVFSEVIRPALADRGGWALFLGTPNGKNQFYDVAQYAQQPDHPEWHYLEFKAADTGLLGQDELAAARAVMTADEYAQEWECSFTAAVKGAIYARELERVRAEGRITVVPYEPTLPVDTDWDLGIGDAMAIWFSQSLRSGEVRLIDYHEASGEGFPYYAGVLAAKGYVYGTHWAPHDVVVRELGTGKSRLEMAASFGLKFAITPRLAREQQGLEVEDGINAARLLLPKCWFDHVKCARGLEALMHYRRDYNLRLEEFKAAPVHDWASHGADAFRGLAVRYQLPVVKPGSPLPEVRYVTPGELSTGWMG